MISQFFVSQQQMGKGACRKGLLSYLFCKEKSGDDWIMLFNLINIHLFFNIVDILSSGFAVTVTHSPKG